MKIFDVITVSELTINECYELSEEINKVFPAAHVDIYDDSIEPESPNNFIEVRDLNFDEVIKFHKMFK